MRSPDQILNDKIEAIPSMQSFLGTFRLMDGVDAVVDAQGGTMRIPFVGTVQPSPGDSVQVEMRNGGYAMIGPSRPKGTRGKVLAVTATPSPIDPGVDLEGNPLPPGDPLPDDVARCLVEVSGVQHALPYLTGYSPKVDDIVSVEWTFEGGLVKGAVSMVPPPPPALPPPSTVQTFNPAPFTATGSNSFQGGSWNKAGRVWSSDSVKGAWLYGSKIADTIPDNAVINYARIWVAIDGQSFGDPANLRLHASTSFSGPPAWVGEPWPLSPTNGWVQIPNHFVDWLKANPGGLGLDSGGYHILKSISSQPLSGALDINYTA